MEKRNHAGDASFNALQINEIINAINNWEPLQLSNLPEQLRTLLERVLCRPFSIRLILNKTRNFPQLDVCDNKYRIWYYCEKPISLKEGKSIILQLSIATVLAACPYTFVDNELRLDETICSFCERYPKYANIATEVCNAITKKIEDLSQK